MREHLDENTKSDIIVIAEDVESLRGCIKLLRQHTRNYRLVVVTKSFIPTLPHPGTAVTRHRKTWGYAVAGNLGATISRSEIICFLSANVCVSEGWLHKLTEPFIDDDVVIAGLVLVDTNGARTADAVCHGACIAVRRDWFDEVGGFYEGLPFGGEDSDLCRRADTDGKAVVLLQNAVIFDHNCSLPAGHPLPTFYLSSGRQFVEDLYMQPKLRFIGPKNAIVIGVPMRDLVDTDLRRLEEVYRLTMDDLLKLHGHDGYLFERPPEPSEKNKAYDIVVIDEITIDEDDVVDAEVGTATSGQIMKEDN